MSAKRKSYSVEYKKGIVEDSWGQNLTAFCKEKMLNIRLVRKWRAEYGNLIEQVDKGNAKKRKCGSGRQRLFSELEDLICEWVVDRRAKALVVNRAQIQEFALAMAPQFDIAPEDFKASQHWLDNFLQRSELSLRRSTTLFRLEDTQVTTVPYTVSGVIGGVNRLPVQSLLLPKDGGKYFCEAETAKYFITASKFSSCQANSVHWQTICVGRIC
ncbi:uncharacterized protein LOC128593945 [Nycticebus coucang]|uniref:uncharacterized protein LOC128593945 n=1 Tax=Nycticebus coucang TaxID=9470 RepID=UPI00234C2778|nr:uncharacterized protein LOC128593945 [Nycticebus coucang]